VRKGYFVNVRLRGCFVNPSTKPMRWPSRWAFRRAKRTTWSLCQKELPSCVTGRIDQWCESCRMLETSRSSIPMRR